MKRRRDCRSEDESPSTHFVGTRGNRGMRTFVLIPVVHPGSRYRFRASLRDLRTYIAPFPAINRWAIFVPSLRDEGDTDLPDAPPTNGFCQHRCSIRFQARVTSPR